MLSAHVSRLLSCKRMFLPISVICWAWENLISHHHWGWSLTDIDALRVDAPRVIILRLAQPSFSVLSPITFMLILLAVILNCDRDRYTAFNQQQNTGALLASDGCIIFSLCWWHFSTVGGGVHLAFFGVFFTYFYLSIYFQIICETSTRCKVTAVLFLFEPFLLFNYTISPTLCANECK